MVREWPRARGVGRVWLLRREQRGGGKERGGGGGQNKYTHHTVLERIRCSLFMHPTALYCFCSIRVVLAQCRNNRNNNINEMGSNNTKNMGWGETPTVDWDPLHAGDMDRHLEDKDTGDRVGIPYMLWYDIAF